MVFFIFIQILIEKADTNSGEPDQTPQNAASDLGLHCLQTSHKKDARLIWVKWSHFTIFRAHYIFAAPEDLFLSWETVRTPMRFHGRIQRGGGGQGFRIPLKSHKNIGLLRNTGPDPLKNHKATKPVFNVGPSSARQRNAI